MTAKQDYLDGLLAGRRGPPSADITLTFSDLQDLFLGPESWFGLQPSARHVLPLSGIVIDGGEHCIRIVCDDHEDEGGNLDGEDVLPLSAADTYGTRTLDLTNLSNPSGGPLPPVIFKNCTIEGVLDLSGSHLSALGVINCRLRGLKADGCQIEGDCDLRNLRPVNVKDEVAWLDDAKGPGGGRYCQVRLIAARIDGTLDLRKCRLRSPRLEDWENIPDAATELTPDEAASQYALCLAGCEIRGRLLLVDDFEAWGGVSLFQANISNSLRIGARILSTHEARELPGVLADRNFAALNARELTLGGTLFWTQASVTRPRAEGNVYGRVELARARIGGDLSIESCIWERLRSFCGAAKIEMIEKSFLPKAGEPKSPWAEDEYASGGIDARYIHISGQLRMGKTCTIGRRYRPMAGLRNSDSLGPAADFWKARIDLGVRIEPGVTLHGAVFLSTAHIERQVFIAATFVIMTAKAPINSPYHLALTFGGTSLKGIMTLRIPRIDGRLSMQKLQIEGSLDIHALAFQHRSVTPHYGRSGSSLAFPAWATLLEPIDRARFDDTSILDMQDVSVTNGINIKLGAISVRFSRNSKGVRKFSPSPQNGFIVDLRGLSCTSWDDADSACWDRLIAVPLKRTPWRIRFEGISFARLDSSTQDLVLRKSAAKEMRTCGNKLGDRLRTFKRAYTTLGTHEIKKLRIAALKSFHDNRGWPPRPKSLLRRAHYWPDDVRRWAWRWSYEPSWRRREKMPSFSPQPYETFAKAYFAKGDLETGISITEARMARQWRKRVRNFTRAWAVVAPLFLFLGLVLLAVSYFGPPASAIGAHGPALIALVLTILPPAVFLITTLMFRWLFAYGLRGGRALLSAGLFVVLAAVATPWVAEGRIVAHEDLGRWLLTEPTDKTVLDHERAKLRIAESLLYGVDKLIPVLDLKSKLYSMPGDDAEPRLEANVDMAGVSSLKIDTGKPQKKPPPAPHQLRYRAWNAFLEVAGWIITSLVVLTLTGVLRRDVER